ncbi:ATP-grasp domain-containing protein [Chitinophaga flava]|uniref:ATP-grasp domain-containing protein n=1 Tax=Chitinophaga flava TaxID=2259036 RepID=A0A365Y5M1_9BACT|nr:ATP-grasp domain-containing protein [Chitinophaga flava]RBL93809.1 hypothetical protein DF182_15040 [Chitinophaga flava]
MKILISDVELRKSFDIANIVGRNYPPADILYASSEDSRVLKVIYANLYLLRTADYMNFERDLKEIISLLSNGEDIVYLPVEERTTLLFYEFLEKNPAVAPRFLFALPQLTAFNISRDKYLLNVFCTENGIKAPEIISFDRLDTWKTEFKPLVYKPKKGSGSAGVRFILQPEDLQTLEPHPDYFFQQFVGDGKEVCGGFYLMSNGELKGFYSHKRIRTYPEQGGVSVYSKSVQNDDIKEIGERLLKKLQWSGWAMIEFLYDEELKDYYIIEINPRAWGSILLSEFNNARFINKYIELSLGKPVQTSEVNFDTYIRWFFPWDLISYAKKRGRIPGFWKWNKRKTCYIGFTYATFFSSFLFIFYSVFSVKHIKKVLGVK